MHRVAERLFVHSARCPRLAARGFDQQACLVSPYSSSQCSSTAWATPNELGLRPRLTLELVLRALREHQHGQFVVGASRPRAAPRSQSVKVSAPESSARAPLRSRRDSAAASAARTISNRPPRPQAASRGCPGSFERPHAWPRPKPRPNPSLEPRRYGVAPRFALAHDAPRGATPQRPSQLKR